MLCRRVVTYSVTPCIRIYVSFCLNERRAGTYLTLPTTSVTTDRDMVDVRLRENVSAHASAPRHLIALIRPREDREL